MINALQLRREIVRPVLEHLWLWSQAAENLVMGTAAQESRMGTYLKQIAGPAVGIFQMEPFTHDDLWKTILKNQPQLAERVRQVELPGWYQDDAREMAGNLYYAAAMCRVFYRRIKEPLPDADDIPGLARYWKRYYNTHMGKGTEVEFIRNYQLVQ